MKTIVLFLAGFLLSFSGIAQNTDLPIPASNLQTLPAGSYVIPMDNTLQTNSTIGSGNFNLAAYGLIVHLLNNNVKLKWVIKAGKTKDGIDFTGNAEQLRPTFVAGAVSRSFIAGPFVIFAADTTGVSALVNSFYTSNSLTGNDRPKVFRTTAAVSNVDIRYDLTGFKPKAAILTDGGNQSIHTGYMTACKIPVANYATGSGNDLLTKCYTFASEPHNDQIGPAVNSTISAIRRFVEYGGNFLAQCAAVENYENNALGRFQTTTGITVQNNSVGTSLSYPNADLSFSQFQGDYNASSAGGSVKNWTINATGINNVHSHVAGTGGFASTVGASVSKLVTANQKGGLVFYVGIHNFSTSSAVGINGIRMYMNAFLTPVSINNSCSIGEKIIPLPVKLTAFNATLNKDQSKVNLTWSTAQEMNVSHFVVEKSIDATNYTDAGIVFANGNTTETMNYSLTDNITNLQATVIYYRLRSVDIDGKNELSNIRVIRIGKATENSVSILTYPNPVTSDLRITVPVIWQNKRAVYEIFNANGQVARRVETGNSSQTENINISSLAPGFYIVKVSCNGETAQQRIVKQ